MQMEPVSDLTAKQLRWIDEYLIDFNGYEPCMAPRPGLEPGTYGLTGDKTLIYQRFRPAFARHVSLELVKIVTLGWFFNRSFCLRNDRTAMQKMF